MIMFDLFMKSNGGDCDHWDEMIGFILVEVVFRGL